MPRVNYRLAFCGVFACARGELSAAFLVRALAVFRRTAAVRTGLSGTAVAAANFSRTGMTLPLLIISEWSYCERK